LSVSNQHSNGILEFDSISESDIGEYVCRGQNRVAFEEEIITLELTERNSPPSIVITPRSVDGNLQIALHSTQMIECLNQNPTTALDISWSRTDSVHFQDDSVISKSHTLFPLNTPLEYEHSGTYTCHATNEYGSTSESITLEVVPPIVDGFTIDIEPNNVFPIDSVINLNCQYPESNEIWWSTINHRRKYDNPYLVNVRVEDINRRFICHAKTTDGKVFRKMIRIERFSESELIAKVSINEMERSLRHNQRKSTIDDRLS